MTLGASTAVIRRWAREQAFEVGDRGRLSPAVVAAYETRASSTATHEQSSRMPSGQTANVSGTGYRIGASPMRGATPAARRVSARTS
jgi:hypothetical protein